MPDAAPGPSTVEERTRAAVESFRPYIQADGGDIDFVKLENNIAHVRLRGACRGCPHAAMTLQMGVERHLRAQVPEIQGVVNVP
jgi:Fe-S cluster biogenesis protein NfuA